MKKIIDTVAIRSPGGLCRPCRFWQYAGTFGDGISYGRKLNCKENLTNL
ncbi:hypothetical protein [Clostridium sp. chh4-2]|nr:hypothetical protein [Clostridium sp. chh4-2]